MLISPSFSQIHFSLPATPLSLFLPISPFSAFFPLIYLMLFSFLPSSLIEPKTINSQHQENLMECHQSEVSHSYSPAWPSAALNTSVPHGLHPSLFLSFRVDIIESGRFLAISGNFPENNSKELQKTGITRICLKKKNCFADKRRKITCFPFIALI